MRNILAIGAYERDNFGDYLFYEVLKRALPDDNIIPGSIIASDMRKEYGFTTVPYDFILKNYDIDAVWVVGGEVGGVDIPSALDMSLGHTLYSYRGDIGKKIEQIIGVSSDNRIAYIPDLSIYPRNRNKPLIINSVGLRGISLGADKSRSLLEGASRISVRESYSHSLCLDNNINATLTPDVVHGLAKLYTPKRQKGKYILLQINKHTLDKYNKQEIRDILRKLYRECKVPIKLFAAGVANGHDSLDAYEDIINDLNDIHIEVIHTREPLKMVDLIASANLVIGTSLHLRIISAAYGIPRISLDNQKTALYSSEWDSRWPSGVTLDTLVGVTRTIDSIKRKNTTNEDKLSALAYGGLRESAEKLPDHNSKTIKLSVDDMILDWFAYQQNKSIETVASMGAEATELESSLRSTIKTKDDILDRERARSRAIATSSSYRIGRCITLPYRLLRKIANNLKGRYNDE